MVGAENLMSFGARLRQERERLGLTQQRFAELGGVKRVSQHLYEQEVRAPDVTYLTLLKEAGVDIWFLITGKRAPESVSAGASRSIYISAFRAVDEIALNADGEPLPLAERERLFAFLIALLETENASSDPENLRRRLAAALAS